uniref:MADF domain-containing protein n=1 Tax=Romanomermis culicivorax TaxID=13658 RepID=A0A915IF06_ROMCU
MVRRSRDHYRTCELSNVHNQSAFCRESVKVLEDQNLPVWKLIEKEVNTQNLDVYRSHDIKAKWKILKSRAKDELTTMKRSASKTGGGQPDSNLLSENSQAIIDAYGESASEHQRGRIG